MFLTNDMFDWKEGFDMIVNTFRSLIPTIPNSLSGIIGKMVFAYLNLKASLPATAVFIFSLHYYNRLAEQYLFPYYENKGAKQLQKEILKGNKYFASWASDTKPVKSLSQDNRKTSTYRGYSTALISAFFTFYLAYKLFYSIFYLNQ